MFLGRLLRSRVRRWGAVAAIALITTGAAVTAQASSDSDAPSGREVTIEAPAGPGSAETISLDASLWIPRVTPAPAIIVAHGFGGTKYSVAADAERLTNSGYVVLTYSARGFGSSGGQIALDSLDYEVADARAVVDFLAEQPEVRLDAPGDPRIGVTGGSYGGGLALMLAGTDDRVDAVVSVAAWNNLQQALFPNYGVVSADGQVADGQVADGQVADTPANIAPRADGVYKEGWTSALLGSVLAFPDGAAAADAGGDPGSPSDEDIASCGRLMPDVCAAYTDVAQTGRITPAMEELLARSSPDQVTSNIKAPTLLVQGEADTLFGLDQADATARQIAAAGTPVAVTWYAGGHNGGDPGTRTVERMDDWFAHYLQGVGPRPPMAFQYAVAGPVAQRGQSRTRTLQAPTYPGLDGTITPRVPITLAGPEQTITNPPGGKPAAITSLPGVSGAAASIAALGVIPGQTAMFASAALDSPLVVTGSVRVAFDIARVLNEPPSAVTDDVVLYFSLAAAGSLADEDDSGQTEDPGQTQDSGQTPSSGSSSAAVQDQGSNSGSDDASGDAAASLAAIAAALSSAPAGGAVAPVRIPLPADGSPVTVTVDLPAVAFQIPAGNRLLVRVATTDQGYFGSTAPAAYRVSLASSQVDVPAVDAKRAPGDDAGQPVALTIALAALVLAVIVGLAWVGRSRRVRSRARHNSGDARSDTVPETDGEPGLVPDSAPLVIRDLAKTYPGGVAAVSDVSLRVERGQVLGLLGPNGAGKTTTLRMVMGLIAPTAGEISVFGESAGPGAPVLSRIGSFVEGSGFLPHLSGAANLDLYWRATGRPAADAHIDEALAIADLGTAINRKVKTYSQGMRQRLAIAQAMLGLPDLLLLDEPTNGLDPPQIHAMREVLRRYAETGRTVLVSSHLLSEVEQTCTHVVVMSRGRTIAAGTVAELVAESGEVTITTPDAAAAAAALRTLPGIGDVELLTTGVAADLHDTSLSQALRTLVNADIEVSSAAPRNRLEDVFLDLVGSGPAGGESAILDDAGKATP